MEEEFETFEVDQQRELVMNATECNNIRLCIFIVDSDNLFTDEETKQTLNFQTFKSILETMNLELKFYDIINILTFLALIKRKQLLFHSSLIGLGDCKDFVF